MIAMLGGAAAVWPLAARAQQTRKLPTVAFMLYDASTSAPYSAAFTERLRELGWTDGRTVAIEYRCCLWVNDVAKVAAAG